MSEMVLRPVRDSDVDRLLELEIMAFGSEAWTRGVIEAELDGHDRTYVVAEVDGQVVGYAGTFVGIDAAEVMSVAVDPAHRGHGYGRALVNHLVDVARGRGTPEVMLEVAANNEAALSLYASMGFEQVSVRRGYYQPSGRDALVMRLRLAPPSPGPIGAETL